MDDSSDGGLVIEFMKMDKLRVWGPVAAREWLARERPVGRVPAQPAQVVQFQRGQP